MNRNRADGTTGSADDGSEWIPDGHEFALLLTHDVDRPYKTYQSLYYALVDRQLDHLLSLLPHRNPYWTFQEIIDLEQSLDVRSAFYFLDEQSLFGDRPLGELLSARAWQLFAGRYDLADPNIVDVIQRLDDGGWEIGLHGSYESYADGDRLAREKRRLEQVLGHEVAGGRQHYLNLERPETWRRQAEAGLLYDTSLGSATECGFQHGYDPLRPFDDEFVSFPLTVMEKALPDPSATPERARGVCDRLLREARDNDAVMTVLWHPRYFADDFPGYGDVYRHLIERARELGAWIGPPRELYMQLDHPGDDEATPAEIEE